MKVTLEKKTALILQGKQGCGKSTMARAIASETGTYQEVEAKLLDKASGLNKVLLEQPDTVIVDGFPKLESLNRVKALIAADDVLCYQKFQQQIIVKTPNFIFCCSESIPLEFSDGRRFRVIHIQETHK